jgi:hypothetical protein
VIWVDLFGELSIRVSWTGHSSECQSDEETRKSEGGIREAVAALMRRISTEIEMY